MELFGRDMISHRRFSKDFNCGLWTSGCWSSIWWIADVCFFLLFCGKIFPTSCTLFLPCSLPKSVFQNGGFSAVETSLWAGTHRGLSCWGTSNRLPSSQVRTYTDFDFPCFAAFFILQLSAVTLVSFYVKILITFCSKASLFFFASILEQASSLWCL